MAISNDLLSSTLYSIRDGEVDQLFQKTAFLDNAKKFGGIEYEDGGIKIQRPLALENHSSPTLIQSGYEAIDMSVRDVLRPAIYNWSDFCAPIVISRREELENSGEKAIVKILEARMRSVMTMLRKEVNRQLLAGDSTVLTTLNTLNGAVAGGFLEAETVAQQKLTGNTVGGISKQDYPNANGWCNQAVGVTADFANNGIRAMQELAIKAGSVAPIGEIQTVLLSEAAMANYRRALFNQERYINEKTLDAGRMQLAFGGAVVEQDLDLDFSVTSTSLDGGAVTAPLSGYFINYDAIKLVMHKDADFALSAFENVSGSTARAAQLYVKMQLIADHLGSCGVLFNADTY